MSISRNDAHLHTFGIDPYRVTPLGGISGRPVIQNSIPVQSDIMYLSGSDQLDEISLAAPFRRPVAFLLELAQVVQVVDVIAIAFGSRGLAAGRQPNGVDANGFENRNDFGDSLPMLLIGGDIPFESLEHGFVFFARLICH